MWKLFTYKANDAIMRTLFSSLTIIGLVSCSQENASYIVQEHLINEAVYASGEILPEEYNFIQSPISAPVFKILVKEGQHVSKGEILVIIGSSDTSDKLKYATNQVNIAKKNSSVESVILSDIQSKIELAQHQYEIDRNNATKYSELLKEQAVSKKTAEEKSLLAERSLTELHSLQKQYVASKNELDNLLITAELDLANILQQYNCNIIKSNISGVVHSILKKEGELVSNKNPILLIGNKSKYKLELMVDERDIHKINKGQTVFFESNTQVGAIHKALITKINPVLIEESRCFKIEADIIDAAYYFPKSTAEASIIIRENAKSLMVPFNYLKGDSVILQSENKTVPIQAGIRINDLSSSHKLY
jgi:multidrug efflux pump subunit AcrA (membrane-fusion protein)